MKYILLLFYFFISINIYSQNKTIYANNNNKVIMIFSSPIKSAIEGSREYIFGYNKNTPNKIGTLIAKKDAGPTNLFVVTTDNKMYSFSIEYKEELEPNEYTKIVPISSSIESKKEKNYKKEGLKESVTVSNPVVSKPISNDDYDFHYKESKESDKRFLKVSKEILFKDEKHYRNEMRVLDKVFFSLKSYYYNNDELFFYLEIDNQSMIDFDINLLKFFSNTKKKKNRTISQQVPLGNNGSPDFTYNLPKRIKKGTKVNFVCVFKKFSLNKNKSLLINLSELKGERVLELEILSKIINNPQTI